MLNCLIVDDEPIARKGLKDDLSEFEGLYVAALAEDAFQALQVLNGTIPIDIIFLDIDMPGLSGLDFLKLTRVKPLVIITTAYPQYALNGFELGVTDYLLKPISPTRLRTAIDKAKKWSSLPAEGKHPKEIDDFLYVKCNGKYEKILFEDIRFFEAANNYIFIHTTEKRLITYLSLKAVETKLPRGRFVRVHKSYIVSRYHIEQVTGSAIVINDVAIPLSRNFKKSFQTVVLKEKLFKKRAIIEAKRSAMSFAK